MSALKDWRHYASEARESADTGGWIPTTCPCCGHGIEVRVWPGEKRVTSGPPERWYPGAPPEVEDITGCGCSEYVDSLGGWDEYERKILDELSEHAWGER